MAVPLFVLLENVKPMPLCASVALVLQHHQLVVSNILCTFFWKEKGQELCLAFKFSALGK
jgi:hypothetical protein